MKKLLVILCLVFSVFLLFTSHVEAQRAECDACGYCVGREVPSNWESCRACLYPSASKNATSNETLILERTASGKMEPVKKAEGTYYTQLGCLNIGADSFNNPVAAGGLLNFLLTRLIFPIVGTLSFISLVYGAFLLMTAQDTPEQVSKGKSYIVGAIVGLIFTLSAVLIINILAGDILRIPGFSKESTVRFSAAGRCEPGAINRGQSSCPNIGVIIKDINTGKEIKSAKLQISGSEKMTPRAFDYKEYSIGAGVTFDPTNMSVTLKFLDDYYPNKGAQGEDKNIYLQSLSINNYTCVQINYSGIKNIPPTVGMYYGGVDATCVSWQEN